MASLPDSIAVGQSRIAFAAFEYTPPFLFMDDQRYNDVNNINNINNFNNIKHIDDNYNNSNES